MSEFHHAFENGGIKGINEYIEDKSAISRKAFSMWELVQWASGLPEFSKDLQKMEERLGKDGIGPVVRELMDKLGIEIKANKKPDWLSTPGSSILLYSNHVRIEPFLLGTLIDRDDVAFVGGRMVQRAGSNIEPHVLPVVPKKFAKGTGDRHTAIEKGVFGADDLDVDEAVRLNQASMQEAGNRLANGWLVGIFPSATDSIEGRWRKGLGEIIKNTPSDKGVRLAPTHFGEVGGVELLRRVRQVYAKGKKPKRLEVKVDFGKELDLNEVPRDLSPGDVSEFLRQDYLKKFS